MKSITTFIAVIFVVFLLFLSITTDIYAFSKASGSSAKLEPVRALETGDTREKILRDYLKQYDSPLAEFSGDFIRSADKYDLDWRLVASIAGLESGFGHHIPFNSYNAWGWGVYGDNVIRFSSWSEGIETISKGLRERYLKDLSETDVFVIGPTYAASPTWAVRVASFMEGVRKFEVSNATASLSITI
ncbi:MAG: glucosaminidase domain-containing protein [Candidatus Levybacteria bacterium]|nr:glucosaminidase domain-containing protein [Candidatus Levybacteria bacterium]